MAEASISSLLSGRRLASVLLVFATLLGFGSQEAHAQATDCSDFPDATIDGFVTPNPPSNINIDTNCTVRNFPASNPLTTNFAFFTQPGQTEERWLIIFDNVVHTGNMSCNSVLQHKIWFTNGSSSKIRQNCQNLLIPVEKIDKTNPPGTSTAAIGVPFTYTLTSPVLFDPATATVIKTDGSVNDLHSVTITDDLNETGVDLTYISHTAYWLDSGAPIAHTFQNNGGLLTFDNFPLIPADEQFVIEITVVLEDSPVNSIGTQFINTAKWDFGRFIDDIFYEPLPGEWGISPPLTIAAPDLVVTKTGPATIGRTLNLGDWGEFAIDVNNAGLTDAWDVVIEDVLPRGPNGGMCDMQPEILGAQVFQSDGTTPVPGKGPLTPGTDFTVDWTGTPQCEMTLTMLVPAAAIGPGERLVIDYRTRLDADSDDGAQLTNVAGASLWYNGDTGNPDRVAFRRQVTTGTPGTADHQDAHTVTVSLFGYFFEKTVENRTTGEYPATLAAPGDTLRYTIRVQTTDGALDNFTVADDLGAMNALPVFEPGSLTFVPGSLPPGANTGNTDPNGGSNGDGYLEVGNLSLPAGDDLTFEFDITLAASLIDGTAVTNQADLIRNIVLAASDDPFVNGQASPAVDGDEDPTRVFVQTVPPEPITKANTQDTAAIGETFSYTVTIPSAPHTAALNDVRILDDLTASAADLEFVSVQKLSGGGGWTPENTGTATNLIIEDPNVGIDIPPGEQAEIEITVRLLDTPVNVAGLTFTNTANWTYNQLDNNATTELPGTGSTTAPMTVVEPELTLEKDGPLQLRLNLAGTFTLNIQNVGDSTAHGIYISDILPNQPDGGMCDAPPTNVTAQVYEADGTTPVGGPLTQGVDFQPGFAVVVDCLFTIETLSTAASLEPGQRLIVSYDAVLDADTQRNAELTNIAGATEWSSVDIFDAALVPYARTYSRALTDGTVGILDHEDAHVVFNSLYGFFFEKTVENLTSGQYPATTAAPGDVLRYSLRLATTDETLNNLTIADDLGELNAAPVFVPGSLAFVNGTVPPGAVTGNTNPNGGSNGDGYIEIGGLSLQTNDELTIQFDITLDSALVDGTVITNQADLLDTIKVADSDDPFVNGPASSDIDGDEDPTQVVIQGAPPEPIIKANTQATATIGEIFTYTVTVPSVPHSSPLYNIRILDNLAASAADLEFVGVQKISGSGAWVPENTGTPPDLVIEDLAQGIDIPAGEQIVIEIAARLLDTPNNIAGLTFTNTAGWTYDLLNDDPSTRLVGVGSTTPPMTVVEPELTLEKGGPLQLRLGQTGTFSINVQNTGAAAAYGIYVTDILPDSVNGGMCDAAPTNLVVQVYEADGLTAVSAPLVEGTDFTTTFSGEPDCLFTLQTLTPAAALAPDQRLIVTYDAEFDADTVRDAVLTNLAGATEWFNLDVADTNLATYARTYSRAITDGTVGTLDHEDAHTLVEFTPILAFEKTVANLTTGDDPTAVATPGDTLRYRLYVENTTDTPVSSFAIRDELDRLNSLPAFAPGSLTLVTVPDGADASGTSATGGAAGTGLLDISGLSIGGLGETLLIEFDVVLAPVLPNDSFVYNQSELLYNGVVVTISDDPNVNGVSDPELAGDEDPTQVRIQSAPEFLVEKISTYLDGEPNVLLAGETLRYTITVQNTGTDNAADVDIVDQVPANTSYVADSTTLNGEPVADADGGGAPLVDGILINSADNATPGLMSAGIADNVATITFDVVVYPDVPDGTVISNQAFVSAADYGIADIPSDDPRTEVEDDPTQDVVGNFPLIFAPKSAELVNDLSSPGIVDPGDTLRYTITVYNNGNVPATAAELTDVVPVNTTYVAETVTLNGEPVGQPDDGTFPLIDGIDISSADLTPPVPGEGEGIINPGESAVVRFDVIVDAGVAAGTLITNQATVYSLESGDVLTDGDGNPATGPEPTVVVVGDVQQLSIIKDVSVVDGGPAIAGAELEYVVTVRNIGTVPALYVEIQDDLDVPNPNYLQYVDQSARLNGLPDGITVNGALITADYFTEYGALAPDETVVLRFRAIMNPDLAVGTTVTNTGIVYWDDPLRQLEASVSIDVGAMPNAGMLSGEVWHDADHDNTPDGVERLLEGWLVELLQGGQTIRTATTDSDGYYVFGNVRPNYPSGEPYSLRFSAPGAGPLTALMGETDSDFTDGQQLITDIEVTAGSNLLALNLPVDPNGIIYDSVARMPIAGATVSLVDSRGGTPLPSACFDDPNQQGQLTLPNGFYKFAINFSDPACPSGVGYVIQVTAPDTSYVPGVSEIIPPTSSLDTLPFDVPACPGSTDDAVTTTTRYCEAQVSEVQPAASVQARSAGTIYHLFVTLDSSQMPNSSQLFNNHIPLDPRLDGAVAVTKTTPMVNVTRGQAVPYIITVSNSFGVTLNDVTVIDSFPAGFKYVKDSARIGDVPTEPTVVDRQLIWDNVVLPVDGTQEIKLLLTVGAGVTEGEFVNRAQAVNSLTGGAMSEEATATVRLVPDPTFDCTDVTGKVYDDLNLNGQQDQGESGIPGVRVMTVRGLGATTDTHGRYHITCALTPNEARGSNFALKLDDRTLPSGFRASTRPVQIQRATRGKALRVNFGASIHRVVGIDIADAVFVPGEVAMRDIWRPRIQLLLNELRKAPSVLRLSYVADTEDERLVDKRLKLLKTEIIDAWLALEPGYDLVVEPEVYWRLGGPPKRRNSEGR